MTAEKVYLVTLTPEELSDLKAACEAVLSYYIHARQLIPWEWQGTYHPQVTRIEEFLKKLRDLPPVTR